MLATGDIANKTTIYDVKTKAKIHEFIHDDAVYSVAFSNEGSMLATGDSAIKTNRNKMHLQRMRCTTTVINNPKQE